MPRFAKGKWTFSNRELWNLDMTLNPIILAGLVQFRSKVADPKESKGIPISILKELFPLHDCNVSDYTEEQLAKGTFYFLEKLDLMIYSFENKEPTPEQAGLVYDKENMFKLISGDVNVYYKLIEQHSQKVKLGFQYFTQHYLDLWL